MAKRPSRSWGWLRRPTQRTLAPTLGIDWPRTIQPGVYGPTGRRWAGRARWSGGSWWNWAERRVPWDRRKFGGAG